MCAPFKFTSTILIFLAMSPLAQASQFFELRGAELSNYGVQLEGEKSVQMKTDITAKIVRKDKGILCENEYINGGGCDVNIVQKSKLFLNDFYYQQPEVIASIGIPGIPGGRPGVDVTYSEISKMKENASSERFDVMEFLFNVSHGTVFTKDGSCYSYVVRFLANPETKEISKYWSEKVAAPCP